MHREFIALLGEARGESEFVIVVVSDIRGFSAFSRQHESPDLAMFIKRTYLRMLHEYFSGASFCKPTGDGLLLVYKFEESSLAEVSGKVIEACMRCLSDFPTLCSGDPMINFRVPQNIGFGIARGTACCLRSGDKRLDYSGQVLNLAARLMDMARPSGIIIDDSFMMEMVPEQHRERFKSHDVYIRSVAEESPRRVFCLDEHVQLDGRALSPISGEFWESVESEFTVREVERLIPAYLVHLSSEPKSIEKIRVTITHPSTRDGKIVKGYRGVFKFGEFVYRSDANEHIVRLDLSKAHAYLVGKGLGPRHRVVFRVQWVPKSGPSR